MLPHLEPQFLLHTHCSRVLQGWEKLTDAVIHWLNDHRRGVVFLLWGAYAQKKGAFIDKVQLEVCACVR